MSLEKFSQDRKNYADYVLSTKRGTRGYHGSSCSEQYHSSLFIHLNDGYRTGNQYCKDPHTFLKDTFQRQQKHVNKWNSKLFNERIKLEVITERFNTSTPQCIRDAAAVLSLQSFLMFKNTVKRVDDYEVTPISELHVEVSY